MRLASTSPIATPVYAAATPAAAGAPGSAAATSAAAAATAATVVTRTPPFRSRPATAAPTAAATADDVATAKARAVSPRVTSSVSPREAAVAAAAAATALAASVPPVAQANLPYSADVVFIDDGKWRREYLGGVFQPPVRRAAAKAMDRISEISVAAAAVPGDPRRHSTGESIGIRSGVAVRGTSSAFGGVASSGAEGRRRHSGTGGGRGSGGGGDGGGGGGGGSGGLDHVGAIVPQKRPVSPLQGKRFDAAKGEWMKPLFTLGGDSILSLLRWERFVRIKSDKTLIKSRRSGTVAFSSCRATQHTPTLPPAKADMRIATQAAREKQAYHHSASNCLSIIESSGAFRSGRVA